METARSRESFLQSSIAGGLLLPHLDGLSLSNLKCTNHHLHDTLWEAEELAAMAIGTPHRYETLPESLDLEYSKSLWRPGIYVSRFRAFDARARRRCEGPVLTVVCRDSHRTVLDFRFGEGARLEQVTGRCIAPAWRAWEEQGGVEAVESEGVRRFLSKGLRYGPHFWKTFYPREVGVHAPLYEALGALEARLGGPMWLEFGGTPTGSGGDGWMVFSGMGEGLRGEVDRRVRWFMKTHMPNVSWVGAEEGSRVSYEALYAMWGSSRDVLCSGYAWDLMSANDFVWTRELRRRVWMKYRCPQFYCKSAAQ